MKGCKKGSIPGINHWGVAVRVSNVPLLEILASYVPALIVRRTLLNSSPITAPELESFPAAVLFADISGFTALTEQLAQRGLAGIEELTSIINAYFEQLIALITAYGGDVVKFAGDALLALWPVETANHAASTFREMTQHPTLNLQSETLEIAVCAASQCAIAIQSMLHDYRIAPGIQLSVHIGIGAGEIFALHVGGVFGRWEFLVGGTPLIQMSVAERQARPGHIVLSPEAWELVAADCRGQLCTELPTANENAAPGYVQLEAVFALPSFCPEILIHGRFGGVPLPDEAATALRAYIPAAILSRLMAGQTDWLAELRRVTVLFINLPGLDCTVPEALEQVQTVMQALQTAMYRYEGSINKLLMDDKGTTLVSALGLPPLAHEDDAVRGLQAALDIQEKLRELQQPYAIGVTTGRAFCGSVGSSTRREYTMIGHVVNMAARLMQAAGEDILCDETTYQGAKKQLKFEILTPITVKGKTEPVPVYRPVRVPVSTSFRSIPWVSEFLPEVPEFPLVGRESEAEFLHQALEALANGHTQTLIIEGEAGIGKSHLVRQMQREAEAMKITVFTGSGDAIEKTTSYYAWRSIFSQLLDLEILWHPQDRQRHVLDLLELEPDLVTEAPFLNAIFPLDLPENQVTKTVTGKMRADRIRGLLQHLLQASVKRSPKLIILEDAHWLDSASWALTLGIAENVEQLLLVITTRPLLTPVPEYQQLLTLPESQHLMLHPLSLQDIFTLVCQRLGTTELPNAVIQLIQDKAQGNPFFSEELAYSLQEQGFVGLNFSQTPEMRLNPALQIPHPYFAMLKATVPDTVQGVITSRIDRLNPIQQLTLKVASVIGRVFEERTLRDIYPIPTDVGSLTDALEVLASLDIIWKERGKPYQTYRFKHIITQEVAYHLMPFSQRRQLHNRVAQWYESTYANDLSPFYALLAHHWTMAVGDLETLNFYPESDQRAGNLRLLSENCPAIPRFDDVSFVFHPLHKAIAYLEKAGQKALYSFANAEAINFLGEALKLLKTLPDTTERHLEELQLQIAIGPALMALKGWGAPEVEQAYERARELIEYRFAIIDARLRVGGDSSVPGEGSTPPVSTPPFPTSVEEIQWLFPVLSGLWTFYQVRGRLNTAYKLGSQLLTLALRIDDLDLLLEAQWSLECSLLWQGYLSAARLHFELVTELYNSKQHRSHAFLYGLDPGVASLAQGAWIFWLLGYPEQACEKIQAAITLAEELSYPFSLAAAYGYGAEIYGFCGNLTVATVMADISLTLSTTHGFPFWTATAVIVKGWTLAHQGQVEIGIQEIRQGLEKYRATGAEIAQTYHLWLLADAYRQGGEWAAAWQTLRKAQAVAQATEEYVWQAEIWRLQGELLQVGGPEVAGAGLELGTDPEVYFQRAWEISRHQEALSLELRVALSLARWWQQQGKSPEEARNLLVPIYQQFTEGWETADLQAVRTFLEQC